MNKHKIVVMGVSGSGKSTIANLLAEQLALPFFDGDDFHPKTNVEKMAKGIPLSDGDRTGWLDTLAQLLNQERHCVVACSALKQIYRKQLQENNPDLRFVYLQGDFDTIWDRMSQRDTHYFTGKAMLTSQFEALEEPQVHEAIWVDVRHSPQRIINETLERLAE